MTPDDARLAHALASGLSHEEAAAVAGVSRATVTRRLRDAAFREDVDALRAAHARRLAERLGALGDRACDALGAVLAEAQHPAARVSAARAVLSHAAAYAELGDLEHRIASLEARTGASNGHRAGAWP